jgi:hypothetical protein
VRTKAVLLISILFLSLIPTIIAENENPNPPPIPTGEGQITDYGSTPTWTYIDTSVNFFLTWTDPENNTIAWARVYAKGGSVHQDLYENTTDNITSDGKAYFYSTDFELPRGEHEYSFVVKSNGSIYQSDSRTLSIVNREPYFLEKPPPKVYVGEVYCYKARAHDPDGDSLTYAFSENFTAGDWVNKTWEGKTFCGVPNRPFTRYINISIYDGYDLVWVNSTIRCYQDENEGKGGGDPPFRNTANQSRRPTNFFSSGSILLDRIVRL